MGGLAMSMLRRLASLIHNLLHKRQIERDLDDEIGSFFDLLTNEKLSKGMSPQMALRAARIEAGGLEQTKEQVRETRGGAWLEAFWRDFRYSAVALARNPGLSVVAVITISLGIGANTAIFSVVNGVLLRPLPFDHPEELVEIRETQLEKGDDEMAVAPADFQYWRESSQSFSTMAAHYTHVSFNLTGSGEAEKLSSAAVSASFFRVLGVEPELGRGFLPEEETPGRSDVVIISHGLWERRLGANPGIAGQSVSLNGKSYTVVGVMPRGFAFPNRVDIWTPIALTAEQLGEHSRNLDRVVARLKPSVTVARAREDMTGLAAQLAVQYPDSNHGVGVTVNSLLDVTVREVRPALMLLLAAGGLVLLIACANVANLMLAGASARRKEMALRAALGASRGRLARQLLSECLMVSLAGGFLGLLLASWAVSAVLALSPNTIPRTANIGVDLQVLGFTLAISTLTGVHFGLAPALQCTRPDLVVSLNGGDRTSASRSSIRTRGLLVITEFALAIALMITAGLMMKSFVMLQQVRPGFDSANVLTMSLSLPESRYNDDVKRSAFFQDFIFRTRTIPGVESAAAIWPLPLSGSDLLSTYRVEGRQYLPDGSDVPESNLYFASTGYFKTMGTRLLAGRDFTDQDTTGTARVAIISETFARKYLPGEDPVGKRLIDKEPLEIVGIVEDVKVYSLDELTKGQVYLPTRSFSSMVVAFRSKTPAAGIVQAIRSQLTAVDPDQPAEHVKSMEFYLSESLSIARLSMLLILVFAILALAMTAAGLYGVLSYSITQRTHEIGIRMALGARRGTVLGMVVSQGMAQAGIGSAIGLAGAVGLARSMAALIYATSPTDHSIYIGVALLLGLVALVASLIPALRATRLEPVTALRTQ
jgi:putative ABC transport system permease protein